MRSCALLGAAVLCMAAWPPRGQAGDDEPARPITRVVRALGEDGAPLKGADVDAYGLPGGTVTKTTGDDGTVRLADVPRKGVTFVARHPGFYCAWHEPGEWSWAPPPEDDDPDGDGVTTMTLTLVRGAALEGRVLALDDGTPVAGAQVEAREENEATDVRYLSAAPIWSVTTSDDGRFRTDRNRPADEGESLVKVRVTARARGWISETLDDRRPPVEFRLRRAALLRGLVLGPDGKPAPGVHVHAYPSDFGMFNTGPPEDTRVDEDEHPRVLHVLTDEQGRYEMPELSPGVKFFVYAERVERTPGEEFLHGEAVARSDVAADIGVAKPGEEALCDLKLRTLSSLAVVVPPEAGDDGKEAALWLDGSPGTLPRFDDEETAEGRTWHRLSPGHYVLHVDARGWAPFTRDVDVAEGTNVTLTAHLERGASIGGIVVDDRGTPVAGVSVYACAGGVTRDAVTDAAGLFQLTGLAPGPVDVGAACKDFIPPSYARMTAPASDVRINLVRAPRLSLRVEAPPGASLPPQLRVTVTPLAGRYAGMRDGRDLPSADLPAPLEGVEPGATDVTVDLPGHAPATIRVELHPGEAATVGPFAFEEGVALAGRVVDAKGRALAGTRVTPYENDDRAVTAGADGRFVLPHLRAGDVDLCVISDGFPETRLVAATGAQLDLVLRPGGVVRGAVKSKDGSRVYDRQLCIYDAAAPNGFLPHWHALVEKKPRFEIRLPAGRYRFVPSRYEFDEGAVFFDVTEGGTTTVDLVLP